MAVSPLHRLRIVLPLLGALVVGATVGFMAIESMTLVDALYMVVITISTVGFAEVGGQLSTGGRVFAMAVIVMGVGSALYTAALALEAIIEAAVGGERRRKRVRHLIDDLDQHIILCGWGRVGRSVWEQIESQDVPVVVVDRDPDRIAAAEDEGALTILGDATTDEVLEQAGLARARALIAAVRSDSDNLVIVLSAKAQRRDLLVVSRVGDAEAERKLYLAGADRVVAPQVVGAHRLAALAMRPDLAEFIDLVVRGQTVEFQIEEIPVGDAAEVAGRSLRDLDLRNRAGAMVLAVRQKNGRVMLNPDPSTVFLEGQVIVAIGTAGQLTALRTLLLPA